MSTFDAADLFSKSEKADKDLICEFLRSGFEKVITTAYKSVEGDSFLAPILMQSAMANFYESIKLDQSLKTLIEASGLNFEELLDEEAQAAYQKYFE